MICKWWSNSPNGVLLFYNYNLSIQFIAHHCIHLQVNEKGDSAQLPLVNALSTSVPDGDAEQQTQNQSQQPSVSLDTTALSPTY